MTTSTEGRPGRPLAAVVVAALLAVAVLHGLWTTTTWPLPSREAYARLVVGVSVADLPSAGMTAGVALLVTLAAVLVAMEGGLVAAVGPRWIRRLGVWIVAGVLGARGLGGLVADIAAPDYAPAGFVRLDLAAYSPLCLLLAAGTAWIAWRSRR